jgi:hypothetical protein
VQGQRKDFPLFFFKKKDGIEQVSSPVIASAFREYQHLKYPFPVRIDEIFTDLKIAKKKENSY